MLEATAFIIKCIRMASKKINSMKCTHLHVDHNTSKVSNFRYNLRETKESTTYYISTKSDSVRPVEEDIFDTRDLENIQFQQNEPVQNISQKIEVEQLFHTPNKRDCEVITQDIESIQSSQSMSCQSAIPNQIKDVLPSVDPDRVFVAANVTDDRDTLSSILDGKAITSYMHVSCQACSSL